MMERRHLYFSWLEAAGAGKSSLVTSFQRWARFLDIDVLAINLDPGAERVHYDPEFDVRDLISLSEVMDEYDLGPNGAQILAADLWPLRLKRFLRK